MASPTLTRSLQPSEIHAHLRTDRKLSLSIKTVLSPRTRGTFSPDPSYFGEHATHYAASEKHRNDVFHDSLHDFQHEFSKQEVSQAIGERTREEEFFQLSARFDEAFATRQHRHNNLYVEAEAQQDGIFQAAELTRQTMFLEGQKARTDTFERDQAPRAQRSEWHRSARATFIQKGREKCIEVCATLEATLIHQFNALLKFQDDEFRSDEQSRDDLIRTILEGGSMPKPDRRNNDAETVRGAEANSPLSIHQVQPSMNFSDTDSPSESRERGRSRDRSQDKIIGQDRSPSPPPTTCPPLAAESAIPFHPLFLPIIPAHSLPPVIPIDSSPPVVQPQPEAPNALSQSIPPVIPFPSTGLGDAHVATGNLRVPPITIPTPSQAPSSAGLSQKPLTAAPADNNGVVETPGNAESPSMRLYDEQFKGAEKQRHHMFLEAESERERHFRTAESAREETEAERMRLFLKNEENRSKQSRAMLEMHDARFKSREETREDAEFRRQAGFKAAQDRRWVATCGELSHIEQQADAEQRFEQDLLEHQKGVIEALYRTQLAQLEAAREDQRARFHQAQTRRSSELGIVSQPQPPKPSPVIETPIPATVGTWYSAPQAPHAPDHFGDDEDDDSEGFAAYDVRCRSVFLIFQMVIHLISGPSASLDVFSDSYAHFGSACSPPFSYGRICKSLYAFLGLTGANIRDKSPNSFLSAGPNVISALPVPKVDDPSLDQLVQLQALHQELTFAHLQRKHQHAFEKSQERRGETFDAAIRRRGNIFHAREAKRNERFERAQRLRKDNFGEEEMAREVAFREAQRIREASFQAKERKREVDFRENETSRDEEFKQSQEYRSHDFHVRLLGLQKFCVDAGKDRVAKLDAWGQELVQGRDLEQRKIFENCRRECEQTFELSLGAYTSEGKKEVAQAGDK
ncbi:hypothetical protein H0H92_004032 [Tricholoma furcatifolium]|nr:hypothetical protein H0H92_004032 [Tricholoma furcatifolium]